MVTKYGMSEKIGPVALESSVVSTGWDRMMSGKGYSEDVAAKLDSEVSRIMDEALTRAKATLLNHRKALDSMAIELSRIETLERREFEELLVLNGIKPKRKEEEIIASLV